MTENPQQFDIDSFDPEYDPERASYARYESRANEFFFTVVPGRSSIEIRGYAAGSDVNSDFDRFRVTVYRPDMRTGVNWQALGAVDVVTTEAFAEALEIAVQIARKFDDDV